MNSGSPIPKGMATSFSIASTLCEEERKGNSETRPFSIRLTADEREVLNVRAGDQPLGTYIRGVLFGENQQPRRKSRRPRPDDRQLSMLLARLGQSRLSSNLNQLAKSANMGTIEVSDNVDEQLRQACTAVLAMREALMIALRMKPGG